MNLRQLCQDRKSGTRRFDEPRARRSSRNKLLYFIAFSAIYLIWGSTYVAIRFALISFPPFGLMATRSIVAGVSLYVWGRCRGEPGLTSAQWRSALLVGALLFLGCHGGLAWAQQRVGSGVASLIIATIPIWMMLLEGLGSHGKTMDWSAVSGIVGGLAGIWILVGPLEAVGDDSLEYTSAAVLLIAAACWSCGSALARLLPRPASALMTTASYSLAGSFWLFLASVLSGEPRVFRFQAVTPLSLLSLGYLTTMGSIAAFAAYIWLLQNARLSAISTYAYVNPVVALLLGWMLAGERLNTRTLVAATLIVASVGLILSSRPGRRSSGLPKKRPIHEKQVSRISFQVAKLPRMNRCHESMTSSKATDLGCSKS